MNQISKFTIGLLCLCAVMWGQAGTAQLNGTVTDQSGSAVLGAEVKATQTATGQVRTTITSANGAYVLANLAIGSYQLEVTKEGFTKYVQSDITLQVASAPTIDISLKVGAVNEQVSVEANAAQVETQATGVGQVIDNQRVVDLPLNGRNSQELIMLAGAAVGGGEQSTNRGYPVDLISVGGGLNNGLTYVLDGGTHNDPYINATMPIPFPDALQEFKVETSSVPAQYGQHAGGAVEAVTKSGTNSFHGTLFEFLRNGVVNARNTFAASRDNLKRNQFGGVIGGPIKKNSLFFFFGDQFTRVRSTPTTVIDIIPTQQMLVNGDWSAISSPACNGGRQITLKAPFVNNTIGVSQYLRQSVNLVNKFPVVTNPCGLDVFLRSANSNEQFIVGRVDYQQSSKNQIFGRYMQAILFQQSDYDGHDILSAKQPNYNRDADSLVLGDTYLISNAWVSSSRATLLRTVNDKNTQSFFSFADLGVQNIIPPAGYAKVAPIQAGGDFSLMMPTMNPGHTNGTDWQFAQDFSMFHGSHQIAFGANFIHTTLNYLSGTSAWGQFQVSAQNTGSLLGDLMLGDTSKYFQNQLTGGYPRQNYFATYVQDTWKVNTHLSVIAGLRWEPYLAPYLGPQAPAVGVFTNQGFLDGVHSKVYVNAPPGLLFSGDPGVTQGRSVTDNTWFHLAPRLGVTWDPKGNGRMVIRAAVGKFYEYGNLDYYTFSGSPPQAGSVTLSGVSFANPWAGLVNPFPFVFGPNATFGTGTSYTIIPKGTAQPYIHQWNFSIQKQVANGTLVSATYMGSLGVHEFQGHQGNLPIYIPGNCVAGQYGLTAPGPCSTVSNETQRRYLTLENPTTGPFYGSMGFDDDNATRSYNALLVSIQRRVASGLAVLANYTWSHCIDYQQTLLGGLTGWDQNQLRHDRGDCELDRRQLFNLSAVYRTPNFSNKTLGLLATGWQISTIINARSGAPITVVSGQDNALTGAGDQWASVVLPNAAYAPNHSASSRNWLNASAFGQPALGSYGNLSPGSLTAPGFFTFDTAISRIFKVREKYSLEVRAEGFNITNRVNAGDPTATAGSTIGGVDVSLTDANFGRIISALDPRILQFAMKFVF